MIESARCARPGGCAQRCRERIPMPRTLVLALLSTLALAADPASARLARFNDWKFGMFIHWGPYSQASVEASWPIMTPGASPSISEADYRALARTFNPTRFDAQAFVDLAREAGQRYMVFTSKHHDGFCMFDSAYTTYQIASTPYQRDLAAQLARAAHASGLPFGFYYSPPDMNHPGFRDTSRPAAANWAGEPTRAEWPLYLDYMELQLRELLTGYGELAAVWFDGLANQRKYDGRRYLKLIRELQPMAVVNDRIGVPGDFVTPEQRIPQGIPRKGATVGHTDGSRDAGIEVEAPPPAELQPWETCMTINGTWAYNRNDTRYKSSTELIRALIDVASKGGNFLLNVGPTPEGTIQPEFVARLRAIGAWLKVNGEAIYSSTYGPWQGLSFGRSTARGRSIYLHVFDWPESSLELPAPAARVVSARMLATGQAVAFALQGGKLRLELRGVAAQAHAHRRRRRNPVAAYGLGTATVMLRNFRPPVWSPWI